MKRLTLKGFGIRFLVAAFLVAITYNPEGWSYYHWVRAAETGDSIAFYALGGIVLLAVWLYCLMSMWTALKLVGTILVLAIAGALAWVVLDSGWVPTNSVKALTYLGQALFSLVVAWGMSFALFRRQTTGQGTVHAEDEDT